jgi:hypothetical protein
MKAFLLAVLICALIAWTLFASGLTILGAAWCVCCLWKWISVGLDREP